MNKTEKLNNGVNAINLFIKDENENDNNDNLQKNFIDKLEQKIIIEQNEYYFQEFTKLNEANLILKTQLKNLLEEKITLKNQIQKLENKCKATNKNLVINDTYTNRRRHRRTKQEISRGFICNIDGCKKSYGSEGSLNQHVKLKHSHKKN